MKLSKIIDFMNDYGSRKISCTITKDNNRFKCRFHVVTNPINKTFTKTYKDLDFDVGLNLNSCTILSWDKCNNGNNYHKYINYYEE